MMTKIVEFKGMFAEIGLLCCSSDNIYLSLRATQDEVCKCLERLRDIHS